MVHWVKRAGLRLGIGSLGLLALLAALAACAPAVGGPSGASIGFRFDTPEPGAAGAAAGALATPTVGDSGADGLISLKYYIWQVVLYQDLVPTGSGFSGETGPLYLYTAGAPPVDYGDFGPAEAEAYPENYVDLLDPADRARLSGSLPLDDSLVGTYRYAAIQWMKPIKVTARVDLGLDGGGNPLVFYTRPGTYDAATENTVVDADDLRSGPAEEAIIMLDNGGFYFKLQEPLEITQEDISAQAQFLVTLNFDPEGLAQGCFGGEVDPETEGSHLQDRFNGDRIFIPYLDLIPIAHRADQVIEREKYLIHVSELANYAGTDYPSECDLRLSLFSVQGDPDRSIVGLELRGLVAPDGQTVAAPYDKVPLERFSSVFGMEFPGDGTITLLDYEGGTVLSGFRRLMAPGFSPDDVFVERPGGSTPFPYELVSLETTGL